MDESTVSGAPRVDGMPMFGLGTWQNDDPDTCAETVERALRMGYRHIDTAQVYGNEAAVGAGLARADVDREDVFLATKVWIDNLAYDDVLESTDASLDRLGVDAVDLLYVHWPAGPYDPEDTPAAFDELYDAGKIDRVGVSNFLPEQVDEAVDALDAPLAANQVELHPLLPQSDLRERCSSRDVEVVAYSPLARGAVLDVPEIAAVAERRDATPGQVPLAWLREKGVTAIPKTSGSHLAENWESLSVDLDDVDVADIDAIDRRERQVDPGFAPW
jgi:2,5-diketo-D-gluconate reductase B